MMFPQYVLTRLDEIICDCRDEIEATAAQNRRPDLPPVDCEAQRVRMWLATEASRLGWMYFLPDNEAQSQGHRKAHIALWRLHEYQPDHVIEDYRVNLFAPQDQFNSPETESESVDRGPIPE